MSTLLDALPAIHAVKPCVLEVVTGPFMPDEQRLDLKRRAQSLPVRMRTMVRNPLGRVAAADLVVAMAGYNTTMEILRLGTPALLVPRRGPSREQRMRTSRFADRGWVAELSPDLLTPKHLARAVIEALSSEVRPTPITPPDLTGLTQAVTLLLDAAAAAAGQNGNGHASRVSLSGTPRIRRVASGP
jgi:predicted glycosyltransferase